MILDVHVHTFPEKIADTAVSKLEAAAHMKAWVRGTPAALRESMAAAGIDLAINLPVATYPEQPAKLNRSALAMNEGGGPILSFGAMHPGDPDWANQLTFLAEHGFKGFKLHPMYQATDLDDLRSLRILGRAAELGLCALVHAGEDIGIPGPSRCTPAQVERVLRETGIEKLILAHMGGWNQWHRVKAELCGAPVYLDTSFSFTAFQPDPRWPRRPEELQPGDPVLLAEILRAHGVSRVLFGSDSPWGSQEKELNALRALGLSPEEESLLLGGNAERLIFQ